MAEVPWLPYWKGTRALCIHRRAECSTMGVQRRSSIYHMGPRGDWFAVARVQTTSMQGKHVSPKAVRDREERSDWYWYGSCCHCKCIVILLFKCMCFIPIYNIELNQEREIDRMWWWESWRGLWKKRIKIVKMSKWLEVKKEWELCIRERETEQKRGGRERERSTFYHLAVILFGSGNQWLAPFTSADHEQKYHSA